VAGAHKKRFGVSARAGYGIGAICGLIALLASAGTAGVIPTRDKLTEDEKIELLRGLDAEYAKVKIVIPRSKKALDFNSDGTWDKAKWGEGAEGPAARVGDQIKITRVEFDGDKLILEINGGLKSGKHWYDHIEAGMGNGRPMGNGEYTPTTGSGIAINFHKPMEGLTSDEVKKILTPIMDFDKRSATTQYVETLPPPIQSAIKQKRAAEGMNREQVLMAVGQPTHKYRESKNGQDTEDWIYGTPPGKITFVTFANNKVIKVRDQYAGLGGDVPRQ
jgi:hypothetical protein